MLAELLIKQNGCWSSDYSLWQAQHFGIYVVSARAIRYLLPVATKETTGSRNLSLLFGLPKLLVHGPKARGYVNPQLPNVR